MRARSILALLLLTAIPGIALSQTPAPNPLDFSGIIFGHYRWHTDSAARAQTGGKSPNRFDLGRVYLNFRVPAGERGSIRVTTDLFQNTGGGGYYAGWTVRLKYAYFQYELTKALAGVEGLGLVGRVGMLHNVVVDHIDSYWARWLSQNAVETHGFFQSADVGAASLLTLPNRRGEIYLTLTNGTGFSAAEVDRFKDIAARFSWTPFANDSGFFRTLAITPWYLKGRTAGIFANGGPLQTGPGRNGAWTDGVQRDRRGLFVGLRERRLTGGAEFAQRIEEFEGGSNNATFPRTVRTRTSDLISAFAFVRPFELRNPARRSRFGVFGRFDDFTLDPEAANFSATSVAWGGLFWDLNARATISLDYQQIKNEIGITPTTRVTVPTQTIFIHWVASY